MNCNEFKTWINCSPEQGILKPPCSVLQHIDECSFCNKIFSIQQKAIVYMTSQKSTTLSQEGTNKILSVLSNKNYTNKANLNKQKIRIISRYAAILVIGLGLLAGIFAGTLISNVSKEETDDWATEFTLMSDNYYNDSELFE